MNPQGGTKHKKLAAKPDKAIRGTNQNVKHKPKTTFKLPIAKGKAKLSSGQALTRKGKESKSSPRKVKYKHQSQLKRVSFIVRLMVDEHNQLRRTEIEHVESRKKQNFLSLDGEALVSFINEFVLLEIISIPPSEKTQIQRPGLVTSGLIISEVRMCGVDDPASATLILSRNKPYVIQARFQLEGSDAPILTAQGSPYDIKIFANEITGGMSRVLISYGSELIQNVYDYSVPLKIPGVAPGLYRLFTLVTLTNHLNLAAFYDGPIIQVI